MSNDCLIDLLDELRGQRPPVFDADLREQWLAAIGAFISNMGDTRQRIKAIESVALDLYAAYGMPKEVAYLAVCVAVFSFEAEKRVGHER